LKAVNENVTSGYQVKEEFFEGPLDLLLHLVTKAKLDICEISLTRISEDYLAYLHHMQELNIEIESSFIVVFASLLEIKSRLLLPPAEPEETSQSPGEEQSPHELVRRLREYKRLKELSSFFSGKEEESLKSIPRRLNGSDDGPDRELYLSVTLADLLAAMQDVLNRSLEGPAESPMTIQKVQITVPERMKMIWKKILREGTILFEKILSGPHTRAEIIVSFLAVLELARLRKIRMVQEKFGAHITIIKKIASLTGGNR